jgi:SAM-dependent methyltransferase
MTVVDIGAGANPHPDADVTVDQRPCADRQADLNGVWPLDTASADRVIARHVFEHLDDLGHAFDEAARVLRDGGWLHVVMPLGHDVAADPTHQTHWTWKTPRAYCRDEAEPWQPGSELRLEWRDLRDLRWAGPVGIATPVLRWAASNWPAWAAHRCYDGELVAIYRRPE